MSFAPALWSVKARSGTRTCSFARELQRVAPIDDRFKPRLGHDSLPECEINVLS